MAASPTKRTAVRSRRIWSKAAYSRALRIGDRIEVAGTTAMTSDGTVACIGDMHGQAATILKVIRDSIEELGGSMDDVVRTRVFTTNIARWQEIGQAHHEAFGHLEAPPVSAFYGVNALLHPEILVEIEASAIVG